MNIQTRHIFSENNYHFLKECNFDFTNTETFRNSVNTDWGPFLSSYFRNEDVRIDIFELISELTKNSIEHGSHCNHAKLQFWDSSDSLLLCYWEDNTTFYDSLVVKKTLESNILIPTHKESGGGHGIPTILSYPRQLIVDTQQKVLFLDIQKPFKK